MCKMRVIVPIYKDEREIELLGTSSQFRRKNNLKSENQTPRGKKSSNTP